MLANMLHFLLLLLHFSRASVLSPRIIGGEPINITEAPYSAVLVRQSYFFCGATIISDKFVISTASAMRVSEPEAYQIRVGSTHRDKGGELYDVKKYAIHPLNHKANIDYDLAVVELKKALTFTDSVKPIPIAEAEPKDGDSCRITGWGAKDTIGNPSLELKAADMKIISREKCRKEIRCLVTDRMVCVFAPDVGLYHGDAGDPVTVEGKLIGIASWGPRIADVTSKPGVLANILDKGMRDFIKKISGV